MAVQGQKSDPAVGSWLHWRGRPGPFPFLHGCPHIGQGLLWLTALRCACGQAAHSERRAACSGLRGAGCWADDPDLAAIGLLE